MEITLPFDFKPKFPNFFGQMVSTHECTNSGCHLCLDIMKFQLYAMDLYNFITFFFSQQANNSLIRKHYFNQCSVGSCCKLGAVACLYPEQNITGILQCFVTKLMWAGADNWVGL